MPKNIKTSCALALLLGAHGLSAKEDFFRSPHVGASIQSNAIATGSACASAPLVIGESVAATLSSNSCLAIARTGGLFYAQRYVFKANAGDQIRISLDGFFDTYLYLWNQAGVIVAYDDDSGIGLNSRIPETGYFVIPETGLYTIEATTFDVVETGTFSLALNRSGPSVVNVVPTSGSGPSGTFTATYSHGASTPGDANMRHYKLYLLLLPTPNVVSYTATGTCLVEYDRYSNQMRLINNAGTDWIPPVTIGTFGAFLTNSQCSVDVRNSRVEFNNESVMLTVPLTFSSALYGPLGTFIQELDANGVWTDMRQTGNWVAYAGIPKPGPGLSGITPSSGSGSFSLFTVTASHSSGANQIRDMNILISPRIIGTASCHIVYLPASNVAHLINDAGTALAGSITPGSGSASNSYCNITGSGMTRSTGTTTQTVSIPIGFNPNNFGGGKNIWSSIFDYSGGVSHWIQGGTFLVQ